MATVDTSFLNAFYPEESLKISNVIQDKDKILIRMKSITACCTCPKCGQTTNNYHGTYMRKVQDLPILGKNVQLEITAHEYNCMNFVLEKFSGIKVIPEILKLITLK